MNAYSIILRRRLRKEIFIMIPCIEYTRASTSRQEYSVGDQDKSIRSWAERNNYKIVRSYCDDGISGHYAAKRPGFLSMIEDITAERIGVKALLIWDSFRFARNMVEFLTYKQMIQEHGISVIAVSEPIVEDEDAQLYIDAINGASGELYLRKLSKDSKRGIRAKVVERKEHLGFAPYGYRIDRNERVLKIVPEEASWVRYIFSEVVKGTPYLQICQSLNSARAYGRRGVEWSVVPLKYLLKNRTYCGELEVNLDGKHGIYEGKREPIISKEDFEAVQKVISERAAKHKPYEHSTNKYVHWLSGLMKCPVCGASMSRVKRPGGRKPAYRCNGAYSGRVCNNGSVRICILEEAVFTELKKIFTDPEGINTAKIETIRPEAVIDYEAEITRVKGQLTRAKRAYIEEIDTLEEYRENKARLTDQLRELSERRDQITSRVISPEHFRARCRHVLDILKSDAPMDEKTAISHDLIERIEADSRTKEINIRFYG